MEEPKEGLIPYSEGIQEKEKSKSCEKGSGSDPTGWTSAGFFSKRVQMRTRNNSTEITWRA